MKVSDIIPDDKDYRVVRIVNHLKKKKKTNPKNSKTGPLSQLPGDSYGIAGNGDSGGDPQGSII